MSAAAPSILASVLRARRTPKAKLLYLYLRDSGGEVANQTVKQIAVTLDMSEDSVTRAAAELESCGWSTGIIRGLGRPKMYRCRPIAEADNRNPPLAATANCGYQEPQTTQEPQIADTGDLFENAPVAAQTPQKAPAEPPQKANDGRIGDGEMSSARSKIEEPSISIKRTQSIEGENPPIERSTEGRRNLESVRRQHGADIAKLEGELRKRFPDVTAPLGNGGDPIAAQLIQAVLVKRRTYG